MLHSHFYRPANLLIRTDSKQRLRLYGTFRGNFLVWNQPVARSDRRISWQTFVLARNRYNSGSPLYFVCGGSEIISSDAVQSGILFSKFNFVAGHPPDFVLSYSTRSASISRQAGMQRLFRGEKYLSGLYADGTLRAEYFFHL